MFLRGGARRAAAACRGASCRSAHRDDGRNVPPSRAACADGAVARARRPGMEMIGIDVGGTGIKAAVVETTTGELTTARVRVETPHPAVPKDMIKATAGLVADLPRELHAGIGFPAVILSGVVKTAANIDPSWIDATPTRLRRSARAPARGRQRRRRRGPGRDALRRRPRPGRHRAHADARNGHRLGAVPRRRAAAEHRARAPAAARQGRRAARRRVDQGEQEPELACLEQAPRGVRRRASTRCSGPTS